MGDNLEFTKLQSGGFVDKKSNDVTVMKVTGGPSDVAAFIYQCVLNVDVDGAGNTYGRNNPEGENTANDRGLQVNLDPKDHLGNACGDPEKGSSGYQSFDAKGNDFYWSSLVAKPKSAASASLVLDTRRRVEANRAYQGGPVLEEGKGYFPVVQTSGPYKGYYISTTATYADTSVPETDPSHWVNGLEVPYAVRTGRWSHWKIRGKTVNLGDVGLAINHHSGQQCGFVFGDTPGGGGNILGESSGALYDALGGTDTYAMSFIVFPGSGVGPILGKTPQNIIRPLLLPAMLDLCTAKNALELATRLAYGPEMTLPKKQGDLPKQQAEYYKNIMSGLRFWGIWPTS